MERDKKDTQEMQTSNPRIYVWYHRKAPVIQHKFLQPMQVGAALSTSELGFATDAEKGTQEISKKNKSYAELTGLYWAWKNDTSSSHLGSFHYRRLLALAPIPYPANEHNTTSLPFFLIDNLGHYGLDEQSIAKACSEFDLVIPHPTDVRAEGATSIRDQFSRHHTVAWFDRTMQIAATRYPQYAAEIAAFPKETSTYFFNMLIAKRELFGEACEFLFSILEELEKEVDVQALAAKDQRLFGFMGERVLSLYFKILMKRRPELKIKAVPCINIPEDKLVRPITALSSSKTIVPVVLAADDGYAPMLGITVNSLIERADPEKQYDIIILDSGLSARRQEQIKALSAQSLHVNIRFITLPSFSLGSGQFFRAQWSFATYNRLLLTELLPYDKIVYLDCDLIVCDDIAKLFAVDIGEALLGAVPDFFVTAEYRKGGEHDIAGRWMTLGQYYKDLLQQSVSSEETFYQAGVLLFNLKKLKKIDASKRFLDLFYRKNPQFGVDQDILNVVCFGQIRPIDYRWNVVNHTDGYLASIASLLSKTEVQQLKQSAANPGCIHFTGAWLAKPFNSLVDFTQYSELFWEEARKTRWYEETLSRALSRDLNRISGQLSHHVSNEMNRIGELSLRRTIRRKLKPILTRCNRFLPSAVREKLKLVPKLQSFYRKVSA